MLIIILLLIYIILSHIYFYKSLKKLESKCTIYHGIGNMIGEAIFYGIFPKNIYKNTGAYKNVSH